MDYLESEVGWSGEDESSEMRHRKGELFIEAGNMEVCEEEETPEDVETWGVYLQGREKTLLGLFWDKELATVFLESVRNSGILEKVKEIS